MSTDCEDENKTMATMLTYQETDAFFDALDAAVDKGEGVEVAIPPGSLGSDSKLWRRLKKCGNWQQIEEELERVRRAEQTQLQAVLSRSFVVGLTGGEIALIAWIATLVFAVLMYSIYKGYDAELEVDPNTGNGKLKLKKRTP